MADTPTPDEISQYEPEESILNILLETTEENIIDESEELKTYEPEESILNILLETTEELKTYEPEDPILNILFTEEPKTYESEEAILNILFTEKPTEKKYDPTDALVINFKIDSIHYPKDGSSQQELLKSELKINFKIDSSHYPNPEDLSSEKTIFYIKAGIQNDSYNPTTNILAIKFNIQSYHYPPDGSSEQELLKSKLNINFKIESIHYPKSEDLSSKREIFYIKAGIEDKSYNPTTNILAIKFNIQSYHYPDKSDESSQRELLTSKFKIEPIQYPNPEDPSSKPEIFYINFYLISGYTSLFLINFVILPEIKYSELMQNEDYNIFDILEINEKDERINKLDTDDISAIILENGTELRAMIPASPNFYSSNVTNFDKVCKKLTSVNSQSTNKSSTSNILNKLRLLDNTLDKRANSDL